MPMNIPSLFRILSMMRPMTSHKKAFQAVRHAPRCTTHTTGCPVGRVKVVETLTFTTALWPPRDEFAVRWPEHMVPTVRPSKANLIWRVYRRKKEHHSMCIQKNHDIPRSVTFAAFEQIGTMDFNNLYHDEFENNDGSLTIRPPHCCRVW